jgi:hypothetical protein
VPLRLHGQAIFHDRRARASARCLGSGGAGDRARSGRATRGEAPWPHACASAPETLARLREPAESVFPIRSVPLSSPAGSARRLWMRWSLSVSRVWAVLLAVVLALATGAFAQDGEGAEAFDRRRFRALERAVIDLTEIGRRPEAERLLELLGILGLPGDDRTRIRERLDRVRVREDSAGRRLPRIRDHLQDAARDLGDDLATLAPAVRAEMADAVLAIDDTVETAWIAKGLVRGVDGGWVSPEIHALAERRAAIQAAMQAVRKLEVPVEVSESRHPLLMHLDHEPGLLVEAAGLRIHTNWPRAKTVRLVQNLVRAVAFSHWLIDGGDIVVPDELRLQTVLFTGKTAYERALGFDLSAGNVREDVAERCRNLAGYYRTDRTLVNNRVSENHALAGLFSHATGVVDSLLHRKAEFPSLVAGHANWVLMSLYGATLPGIAYDGEAFAGTTTDPDAGRRAFLIGAGLVGARSWLRAEAAAKRDPAWSRSFEDQVGKIDGVVRLKATFVVEYLQQQGPLRPVLDAARPAKGMPPADAIAVMQEIVGGNLGAFEQKWRAWLLGGVVPGGGDCLVALLGGGAADLDPESAEALRIVREIRKAAIRDVLPFDTLPPIEIDRELSAHARLHAAYLVRHPDQAAAWPDAHEEFTDREGFTPEGAWSGGHSVIAPGTDGPRAAIVAWMGTYYHRLPFLDPGLLRIGWGREGSMCVLDNGSVVRPVGFEYVVVWPPNGIEDVPRRFRPELPNPFPGEDQSAWGYPITLQVAPKWGEPVPRLALTLRVGDGEGPVVDALVSSPHEPGNELLVPPAAWCLIPREPLRANTTYHVTAQCTDGTPFHDGNDYVWTFRTGR